MEKNITGMMIYYYIVCQKKLWYFIKEISMEQQNENVQLGKLLDENSHTREEKHLNIDNVINIDYIKEEGMIYEIKKSRKIEEASIWQVKYYLYYLRKKGVNNIKAKIDYPLLKQTKEILLEEEDIKRLEEIIDKIKEIADLPVPPEKLKKKICKACAYYDLCYI